MKIITIHWTEMRVIEVPETCSSNSITDILDWMAVQDPCSDLESISIDRESRDMEIVDVITTTNERSITNEKWYNEKTGGTGSFTRDK